VGTAAWQSVDRRIDPAVLARLGRRAYGRSLLSWGTQSSTGSGCRHPGVARPVEQPGRSGRTSLGSHRGSGRRAEVRPDRVSRPICLRWPRRYRDGQVAIHDGSRDQHRPGDRIPTVTRVNWVATTPFHVWPARCSWRSCPRRVDAISPATWSGSLHTVVDPRGCRWSPLTRVAWLRDHSRGARDGLAGWPPLPTWMGGGPRVTASGPLPHQRERCRNRNMSSPQSGLPSGKTDIQARLSRGAPRVNLELGRTGFVSHVRQFVMRKSLGKVQDDRNQTGAAKSAALPGGTTRPGDLRVDQRRIFHARGVCRRLDDSPSPASSSASSWRGDVLIVGGRE